MLPLKFVGKQIFGMQQIAEFFLHLECVNLNLMWYTNLQHSLLVWSQISLRI